VAVELGAGVIVDAGEGELVLDGRAGKGDGDIEGDDSAEAALLQAARNRLAVRRAHAVALADFMPVRTPRAPGWISGFFSRV